jgi:hypothetical protein
LLGETARLQRCQLTTGNLARQVLHHAVVAVQRLPKCRLIRADVRIRSLALLPIASSLEQACASDTAAAGGRRLHTRSRVRYARPQQQVVSVSDAPMLIHVQDTRRRAGWSW